MAPGEEGDADYPEEEEQGQYKPQLVEEVRKPRMVRGAREFCNHDGRERFAERGEAGAETDSKAGNDDDLHLCVLQTGSALTISTRMIAARIAEMMLETRPRTTMRQKTIDFREKRPTRPTIASCIRW